MQCSAHVTLLSLRSGTRAPQIGNPGDSRWTLVEKGPTPVDQHVGQVGATPTKLGQDMANYGPNSLLHQQCSNSLGTESTKPTLVGNWPTSTKVAPTCSNSGPDWATFGHARGGGATVLSEGLC